MKNLLTFYYALRNGQAPWYSRLTALLSLIYLLSPADLVPDIIPLAGYIDDLVVVPFLINISARLLPADVKRLAEQKAARGNTKIRWAIAGIIVLLIAIMVGIFFLAMKGYDYVKDAW